MRSFVCYAVLLGFVVAISGCASVSAPMSAEQRTKDLQTPVSASEHVKSSGVWFLKCSYASSNPEGGVTSTIARNLANSLGVRPLVDKVGSSKNTFLFWTAAVGEYYDPTDDPRKDPVKSNVSPGGGTLVKLTVPVCPQNLAYVKNLIVDAGPSEPVNKLGPIDSRYPASPPSLNELRQDASNLLSAVRTAELPWSKALRPFAEKHLTTLREVIGSVRIKEGGINSAKDVGEYEYKARSATIEEAIRILSEVKLYVDNTYAQRVPPATASYWSPFVEALEGLKEARNSVAQLRTMSRNRAAKAEEEAWREVRSYNACDKASTTGTDSGPTEKEMCEILAKKIGSWTDAYTGLSSLIPIQLGYSNVGRGLGALFASLGGVVEGHLVSYAKQGQCVPEPERPGYFDCKHSYRIQFRKETKFSEMFGGLGRVPEVNAYYRGEAGNWILTSTLEQARFVERMNEAGEARYKKEREDWDRCRLNLLANCGPEPIRTY